MSHHEPQKYLYDMLSSCEFLLEFTRNRRVRNGDQSKQKRLHTLLDSSSNSVPLRSGSLDVD